MSVRNPTGTTTPDPVAARPLTVAVVSAGMSDASSTSLLADRLAEAARDGLAGGGSGLDRRTDVGLGDGVGRHDPAWLPDQQGARAVQRVVGTDAAARGLVAEVAEGALLQVAHPGGHRVTHVTSSGSSALPPSARRRPRGGGGPAGG